MLVLIALGCSSPKEQPAPKNIPEVAEKPSPQPAIPELSEKPAPTQASLAKVLSAAPPSVSALYSLHLSADHNDLTIDPAIRPVRKSGSARSGGFTAVDSAKGGKIVRLDGGPFASAAWDRVVLGDRVTDPMQRKKLVDAGYDLQSSRDVLVVTGKNDPSPTLFAFSEEASKRGLVVVCSEVSVLDFNKVSRPMVARKPVIYLYPEAPTKVQVEVRLRGEFLVRYPPTQSSWTVQAEPNGMLTHHGRQHRYLYWEGLGADFELDPRRAHLVARADTVPFLESACAAHGLTDVECGDFVTFWLPMMVDSSYNVVQFLEEEYEAYASLVVSPEPDTVIRMFMLFEGVEKPVSVGSPDLPTHERSGFTVVEWGGTELD